MDWRQCGWLLALGNRKPDFWLERLLASSASHRKLFWFSASDLLRSAWPMRAQNSCWWNGRCKLESATQPCWARRSPSLHSAGWGKIKYPQQTLNGWPALPSWFKRSAKVGLLCSPVLFSRAWNRAPPLTGVFQKYIYIYFSFSFSFCKGSSIWTT